jgi:hypothetical protein
MVDVMFFSGVMDDNGEIRLTKVQKVLDRDVPIRVNPVISRPKDIPITDPTLAAFHEPKTKESDK